MFYKSPRMRQALGACLLLLIGLGLWLFRPNVTPSFLYATQSVPQDQNHLPLSHQLYDFDAVQTGCGSGIATVDPLCPKFLLINPRTNSGAGDRFFRFCLLLFFAIELRATPVYDPEGWEEYAADGDHGNYSWIPDFFGWGTHMLNASHVVTTYNPSWEPFNLPRRDFMGSVPSMAASMKCNSLYGMGMVNFIVVISALKNQSQIFTRMRDIVQCNFLQTPREVLPPLLFKTMEEEYNVVIHIRTGDLRLHQKKALGNLKPQLERVLAGYRIHYYFVAQDPQVEEGPPRGFEYLNAIFGDGDAAVTYSNSLDVPSALYHMMNADMLVLTGSNLPYIAAMVSPKPIVIHLPNKSGDLQYFKHPDFVLVNEQGFIYQPQLLASLRAKIVTRHHFYRGKIIP